MAKNFNPAKYIKERARKLPIYKCYVHEDWEFSSMPQVIVSRQHVNGNLTFGIYLVDLMCLGIKDTIYMANEDPESLSQIIERSNESGMNMMEIDYNLAHNIIYAGYEFALDSGLDAHKDFEKITKYILEEDDEKVPLIPVECGEDGVPHYMRSPMDTGTFAANVVRTLTENLGEGNFIYSDMDDDEFDEDEFDDDDDFGFDDDFYDEMFEGFGGFDEEEWLANKIEYAKKLLQLKKEEFEDEDGNLEVEKLKAAAMEIVESGFGDDLVIGKKRIERMGLLANILTNHYTDWGRVDDLIEKWSSDKEIDPYYEFQPGMDTEDEVELLEAAYADDMGLREINLIKKKIKNPALADFIIVNNKIMKEYSGEETDEELKQRRKIEANLVLEFKEKHPDFPLAGIMGNLVGVDLESLTIDSLYGEETEISIYEFEKYLLLKQKLIFRRGDLTEIMAFDKSVTEYIVDREFSYGLELNTEAFTQMLAFDRVIRESENKGETEE